MNIQVVRCDGSTEVLTLTEPLEVSRGEGMNCLKTSTGMEHFFLQDGRYDGWGMPCNFEEQAESLDESLDFAQTIDNKRDIRKKEDANG